MTRRWGARTCGKGFACDLPISLTPGSTWLLFYSVFSFFLAFWFPYLRYPLRLCLTVPHFSSKLIQYLCVFLCFYKAPDVQAGFKKGRGTKDQIANICWIMEKAREFQKNIHFCFIDYAKAFGCVDHNKLWKILKEMGIPDHLTCRLRNLYAGQEATVRTGHGTDWFQIGKGVHQDWLLSPCLFNLYAEYIMRNAGLEEAQAGIKI